MAPASPSSSPLSWAFPSPGQDVPAVRERDFHFPDAPRISRALALPGPYGFPVHRRHWSGHAFPFRAGSSLCRFVHLPDGKKGDMLLPQIAKRPHRKKSAADTWTTSPSIPALVAWRRLPLPQALFHGRSPPLVRTFPPSVNGTFISRMLRVFHAHSRFQARTAFLSIEGIGRVTLSPSGRAVRCVASFICPMAKKGICSSRRSRSGRTGR